LTVDSPPASTLSEASVSQSSKRPGAKDISELKARLGLKKGSPAAGPSAGSGGVVAPPGARPGGGVIPAPPGAGPPPRPAIPDAKQDPFAAMNAMAAQGAVAAQHAVGAQQPIAYHETGPLEHVHKRSRALKFALIGAGLLAPLALGVVVGVLAAKARAYNRTIDDAAEVRDDTKKVGEGLLNMQTVLQTGRERSRGAQSFVVGDPKLTAELSALPPLSPNIEMVFRSRLYELDYDLIAGLLSFYVEALELNDQVKQHVTASRNDEKVFKQGEANQQAFAQGAYAGLIELPSEEEARSGSPVRVRVVQLGSPVCEGQTKPSDAGCGTAKITGFRYRVDELGPWQVKKTASAGSGTFDPDGLVQLDPSSKVLQQLAKGGGATVAEAGYMARINAIYERVTKLVENQGKLEKRLNTHAKKEKQFTFFL
jgi:hypothetical protein